MYTLSFSSNFLFSQTPNMEIGIWNIEKTQDGFNFYRNESKQEDWHRWVNRQTINISSKNKKILVLGESVARGFFYDPSYNLAMALKNSIHNILPDSHAFDVIDLANNGLTLSDLSIQLDWIELINPDIVIIVAGNNFLIGEYLIHSDLSNLQEKFDREGWQGAKKWEHETIKKYVKELILNKLLDIEKNSKTTIIFCIPCPNFQTWDWKGEFSYPLTNNVVKINDWITSQQLNQQQKFDYKYFNRLSLFRRFIPGCPFYLKQFIKNNIQQYSTIKIIDLYDLFQSGKPQQDFFLDYCHLNSKGFSKLIKKIINVIFQLSIVDNQIDKPHNNLEAEAHFIAAIHHSRYGQPYYQINNLLEKAVEFDESIKVFFLWYLKSSISEFPRWFFSIPKSSPIIQQHFYTTDFSLCNKFSDSHLHTIMMRILNLSPRYFLSKINSLSSINLLSPQNSRHHVNHTNLEVRGLQNLHYVATFPVSIFRFWIGEPPTFLRLFFTFKSNLVLHYDSIKLFLNNIECFDIQDIKPALRYFLKMSS